MFAVTNADLKECFHYSFALIVVALLIVLAVIMSYDIFILEFFFFCTTWNFVVDGHLCWQKNRVN